MTDPTRVAAGLPSRPPRCPDYRDATEVADLLPFFESVARRPFSNGLWAAWDLQPGERVLLRVDSWHDPLCVEAAVQTLVDHLPVALRGLMMRGCLRR